MTVVSTACGVMRAILPGEECFHAMDQALPLSPVFRSSFLSDDPGTRLERICAGTAHTAFIDGGTVPLGGQEASVATIDPKCSQILGLIELIENTVFKAKASAALALSLANAGLETVGRDIIRKAWENQVILSQQDIQFILTGGPSDDFSERVLSGLHWDSRKTWDDSNETARAVSKILSSRPSESTLREMIEFLPDFSLAMGRLGMEQQVSQAMSLIHQALKSFENSPYIDSLLRAPLALAEARLGMTELARESMKKASQCLFDPQDEKSIKPFLKVSRLRAKLALILQDLEELECVWKQASAWPHEYDQARIQAAVIKRRSQLAVVLRDRGILFQDLIRINEIPRKVERAQASIWIAIAMEKLGMKDRGLEMVRKAERGLGWIDQADWLSTQSVIAVGKAELGLRQEAERVMDEVVLGLSDEVDIKEVVKRVVEMAMALKDPSRVTVAWSLTFRAQDHESFIRSHAQFLVIRAMSELTFPPKK
jgi:hypothetical protein